MFGRAVQRTHIKNIMVFFHPMAGMQVASGKFSMATGEAEITRLESEVSYCRSRLPCPCRKGYVR